MRFPFRIVPVILLIFCTLPAAPGCALFQEEPQKIETVDEFVQQPRVKITKEADAKALKSRRSSGRMGN